MWEMFTEAGVREQGELDGKGESIIEAVVSEDSNSTLTSVRSAPWSSPSADGTQ